jgi:polyisoprenyl-phosphate glycosyltransferase
MTDLSVIVPCFNEAQNLAGLYKRVCDVAAQEKISLEIIFVDDHSADGTYEIAARLSDADERVRVIRLARNEGSHIACVCGLEHSKGRAAVLLAADLQDPPEVIPQLLRHWRAGAQVVWATRAEYKGRNTLERIFPWAFNFVMARILGNDLITQNGADFFLIDRVAIAALLQHHERNLNLFATVAWLGFDQRAVSYVKEARAYGKSGWTLRKKLKLAVDSIAAFTYFPIRAMSLLGIGVTSLGFIYCAVIVANYLFGRPVEGWTSIMVVLLIMGGLQITILGVLGEYLWRTFDEARRRPRYNVERATRVSEFADNRAKL